MFLPDAHITAVALMSHHGLKGWSFAWDDSTRRFGVCKYRTKTIGLSRRLVELNGVEEVRNTILHEIAHALAPVGAGHGNVWKRKALEVGARPERCYQAKDVKAPARKFTARCPSCALTFARDRRTKSVCRKCSVRIVWKRAS
jgi:predicted SprT family Zn-dependent metalloprotease